MKNKIYIGSRESRLAVVQSRTLLDFLKEKHPQMDAELLTMKTTGDIILDRTLDKVGGKGLFVKELDRALLEKRSDLSVHSLKDMPMEVPRELPLLAFSKREDPRDVLVLPQGEKSWDMSRPVGCASLRRQIQLQEMYPTLTFWAVRGNVLTRLRKLDDGEYGALILAAAGLKRLGLEHRISRYFEPDEMIPAAGQGILAVQGRRGEDYSYLEGFGDADSARAAAAERGFVAELNGGCSSPAAAYATVSGEQIRILGLYYDEETGGHLRGSAEGSACEPEKLGRELAERLRKEYREMVQKTGKVWLVGAGPSDPGLLTLKGREVLEQAEVVVYDALVGQAILNMIPSGAELINVGKRASHHTMPQEEINRVLVREAKLGKRVVRLKGGDPFLFGRGGEELEPLCEQGISYEVVPGVTSAVAVPAYSGIPVTHRDFCSSVHIITGHKKKDEKYDIDFEALVRTRGTLVFLMGAAALGDICRGLIEHGMDADMPAAVIQKGTTAAQKRIVATVSDLEDEVKRQGIDTPAIIVVGKVCSMADKFAWYENLPLAGKKILVTRPKELISSMADKLRRQGAEVLELPAIRTVPIRSNQELDVALGRLADYDWVVFTSPTGVRIFFDAMKESRKDIRSLANAKFAVIGSGTKKALEQRGIYADLVPPVYDGKSLGEALVKVCHPGAKVLIPRASAGSRELTDELKNGENIIWEDIATYDTLYENSGLIDERAEFENGSIDYAVFTSASTVKGFARAVEGLDYGKVKAVCIGKQTRAAADALGMRTYMAKKATMDSVVECVVNLCREER